MSSKGVTGGPWGHKLKLTLDILEFLMKNKKKEKKVLGGFNGSFENYTRYFGGVDEEQIKKCLRCF